MSWSLARRDLEAKRDALSKELDELVVYLETKSLETVTALSSEQEGDAKASAKLLAEQLRHINANLAALYD